MQQRHLFGAHLFIDEGPIVTYSYWHGVFGAGYEDMLI
jgi:hypothetical protein